LPAKTNLCCTASFSHAFLLQREEGDPVVENGILGHIENSASNFRSQSELFSLPKGYFHENSQTQELVGFYEKKPFLPVFLLES